MNQFNLNLAIEAVKAASEEHVEAFVAEHGKEDSRLEILEGIVGVDTSWNVVVYPARDYGSRPGGGYQFDNPILVVCAMQSIPGTINYHGEVTFIRKVAV